MMKVFQNMQRFLHYGTIIYKNDFCIRGVHFKAMKATNQEFRRVQNGDYNRHIPARFYFIYWLIECTVTDKPNTQQPGTYLAIHLFNRFWDVFAYYYPWVFQIPSPNTEPTISTS